MTAKMTITDTDWTTDEQAKSWADDGILTQDQCLNLADTVEAWMVLHLHEEMPGWEFKGNGAFSGPATTEQAYSQLLGVWVIAVDYVIEHHLDEIRAQA